MSVKANELSLKQVPFSRSSLNHDDVLVLDTKDKLFQFNGANSNIQERATALEVIQFLKDKYHEGMCDVAIVDDGKLQTKSDYGEFWVIFVGFAPISKKVASEDDFILEKTSPKLYRKAAEEFVSSQNRPKSTRVTRIIQSYETHTFKSNFDSGSAPSTGEEGRGKVAGNYQRCSRKRGSPTFARRWWKN